MNINLSCPTFLLRNKTNRDKFLFLKNLGEKSQGGQLAELYANGLIATLEMEGLKISEESLMLEQ